MKEYDFGLSWSSNETEYFIDCLKEACREKRLSFIWISNNNVREIIKRLEASQIRLRFLLDTEATYNKVRDSYARICYAVKDSGGVVINDPDRTKTAIDKANVHYELRNLGITAPYTVIVRNWEPSSFRLTDEEKANLGIPFVIKPASGYGQLGVVRDALGSIREIARARNFDRGDNFLLQEKIKPIVLGGKRAWFRTFHVINQIIPCWWDDQQNRYEHVTYEEFNTYRLFPLAKIVSKIAAATRMIWFSTEITIDKKFDQTRFLAIDYVNDQCDMTAKSESPNGVPDAVVRRTAKRMVSFAYHFINQKLSDMKYTIWLRGASIINIRGLGNPPAIFRQESKLPQKKKRPFLRKIFR